MGEARDDAPLLHALTQAVDDARLRLGSAGRVGEPNWTRYTLEIELADPPTPIIGTDYAQAGGEIEPALDGVAVRRGNEWQLAYPSVLQALNAAGAPAETLLSLVMRHGIPAREFADIPASERVGLYKFQTRRVVQPTVDDEGVEVFRGSRLEPMPTPATASVLARNAAQSIARWFANSLIVAPSGDPQGAALMALGLRGDYDPAAGVDSPVCAPAAEQALSAYSLARFANIAASDDATRTAARATACSILDALAQVSEIEGDPLAEKKSMGWILLGADELGSHSATSAAATNLVANARGLIAKAPLTAGDPLDQAVTAAALAALDHAGTPAIAHDALIAELDRLWTTTPRGDLIGVLDWLILADASLGAIPEAHASLARATRMALARAQLSNDPSPQPTSQERIPPDLVGAFALSGIGGRGASGQSARPGHALALMLSSQELTPRGEQFRARQMQIAIVRFLRQLAYDEVACYLSPDARRTLGAVRTAPWDSRVAVAGNAMALLCLSESAAGLERIHALLPSVESSSSGTPTRGTP